ncbi:MAG: M20/M25/M40 family metallo-hydrolase [Acidimicrobiales bacterium]
MRSDGVPGDGVTSDGLPGDGVTSDGLASLAERAERFYEVEAMPALEEYVRIPCLSPEFDSSWEETGHIDRAARHLESWAAGRDIAGLRVEVVKLPGLTPVVFVEAPPTAGFGGEANGPATVIYGHLDKQPPLGEWRQGLDPFVPVREGDHLYGRGTADDGYSIFAALGAMELSEAAGIGRGRCIAIIEASEESGSPHLGPYLDLLAERLGPAGAGLVVCLDSGCLTYDRLWTTTSLRGIVVATIRVEVLSKGVHSGSAGGVVPSSFRILRRLLSRVEDEETGEILIEELTGAVPPGRRREIDQLVAALGDGAVTTFPVVEGLRLGGADLAQRVLARTWAPSLAFVGIDGVPPVREAGNVLRAFTEAKIAIRVPPSCDADRAARRLQEVLSDDPPEGARVTVHTSGAQGFDAPPAAGWLDTATSKASRAFFGAESASLGEGGSIPFLADLAGRFPRAQFLVTGVLGEGSNAHGPNEMLHLPTAKALTASIASILSAVP